VPVVAVVLIIGSASGLAALVLSSSLDGTVKASISGVNVMPMTLVYQYKDTHNLCTGGPPCSGVPPELPHAWDHAAGSDGVFGTADDCPHCSAFSAPAAISMVAAASGRSGQYLQQDRIYDNGKSVPPEVKGDNEMQTHGVGMYGGAGGQPDEVQDAVKWSLGNTIGLNRHGSGDSLTPEVLEQYIFTSRPVLWIDHGGWPVNQSSAYPPAANKANQGHAKVIAGYDDNNTVATEDDLVLVYDPWPEYNKRSILPVNATAGPGGTFDPYWLPLSDVDLADAADVFFVSSVSIPEFSSLLLPVFGILIVAVVVYRTRAKHNAG
jgi:hypothetical protein